MRVTTFIAGMAVGALAGMCLADRRTLTNLQSRIQLAGDVVTDVVGMAGGKVMDTAMTALSQVSSMGSQLQQQVQGGAQQQAHAGGMQQAQAGGTQQSAQASGMQQQAQAGSAQQQKTQQQAQAGGAQQDKGSLGRIKELSALDPELKRQVDAIIHEAGSASTTASQMSNQAASAAKSTTATSSKTASATSTTH